MQFYWKQNRRPGVVTSEGESELLAQFLAVEMGLSKIWVAEILSELNSDPGVEWIGDVMQFTRQGDSLLVSSQYDEENPPDQIPLSVFIAALKKWDEYVRKGVSDERYTFPNS